MVIAVQQNSFSFPVSVQVIIQNFIYFLAFASVSLLLCIFSLLFLPSPWGSVQTFAASLFTPLGICTTNNTLFSLHLVSHSPDYLAWNSFLPHQPWLSKVIFLPSEASSGLWHWFWAVSIPIQREPNPSCV